MAEKKPESPPPTITVIVDERWLCEWVAYGFVEIEELLAKYAAFDAYCHEREGT